MSSHPGSDLNAAIELACYLRDTGFYPEQVQDFYPTPGTLSTCMFYTGLDPRTMQPVFVARSPEEKAMQRALMQYSALDAVQKSQGASDCGREDLIGYRTAVPCAAGARHPGRPPSHASGRQSGARAQGDSPPRQAAAKQRKAAEPPSTERILIAQRPPSDAVKFDCPRAVFIVVFFNL